MLCAPSFGKVFLSLAIRASRRISLTGTICQPTGRRAESGGSLDMVWTQSGLVGKQLSRRTMLAGGFGALAAAAWPRMAAANSATEADTSDQTRDDAIRSLPLDELTSETRRKLMAVCERPTLFRRLPQQTISC